jgi:uncharacterized membrane-anchored protein
MTLAQRNLWLGIAAVAAVQIAVLGWMIWERAHLLAYGQEIELEVVPVDPRSLFRGDYVDLSYPISRLELPKGEKPLQRGDAVYVTLRKAAGGKWELLRSSAAPPDETRPDEVVLKGRVTYAFVETTASVPTAMVAYGIESFFVPEGKGRELEQLVRDRKISVILAVDGGGNAGIKGLIVDGKRVYEEPLL